MGTLFVVATPIGNLEDITLRALRVLREVSLIAAEDTRRTKNLLRHYDLATPLVSLHAHNERHRLAGLLRKLQAGESIAVVSDAGTPGISDPGAVLVKAAREAGIRVDPIPGPSAVTAALSASGLCADRFVFAGFPPIKSNARIKWLDWVRSMGDIPIVCFEAPHRIDRTLAELRKFLVNRPIIIARELTKIHEEWVFPGAGEGQTLTPDSGRGEFVLVLGPTAIVDPPPERSDQEIQVLFGQITEHGGLSSKKEAIKATAQRLGLSVKSVYATLERLKKPLN